jgi:hypothetical protein
VKTARVQRALLIIGFLLAAFLLIRFAIDFTREMPLLLAVPFCLLVASALGILAFNLFRFQKGESPTGERKIETVLLLMAIPLGFLASSLDCSGLSPAGCTPFCTFIKTVWIPLLAVVSLSFFFWHKTWLLLLITAMSFVPLVPHCICYNVGNGWWIERIGASPTCYAWGFIVCLIAVSAIMSKARPLIPLLLCGTILSGAFSFFVAHHYFHFPW